MRRPRTLPLVLVGALGGSVLAQQRPAPPEVTGAQVFLVRQEVPAQVVTFTNLSDVALQGLTIEVQAHTGPIRKSWNARPTAIAPGGTGQLAIPRQAGAPAQPVKATLAIFSGGIVEGDPADVARLYTQAALLEEDLSAWRDALSVIPRRPQSEAVGFLRATIEQRLKEQAPDPSGMRRLAEVWLREDRSPGFTTSVIDSALRDIDGRLSVVAPEARAARQPRRPRPMPGLIRLDSVAGTTREYVVKIANGRDAPLEAWAAIVTEAKSGRLLRAIGRDMVRELERGMPPPGLEPGELRAIGTYQPDEDVAGGLAVHIEFAMWQDLFWQGSQEREQRTLTNRERTAEEHTFFIGSLKSAAELPAPQALDVLRARQREFRAGPLGRQSFGLETLLTEWERLAARAPTMLSNELKAHAAALERSRAALLRHRQAR
jgi:hypothetical protein